MKRLAYYTQQFAVGSFEILKLRTKLLGRVVRMAFGAKLAHELGACAVCSRKIESGMSYVEHRTLAVCGRCLIRWSHKQIDDLLDTPMGLAT